VGAEMASPDGINSAEDVKEMARDMSQRERDVAAIMGLGLFGENLVDKIVAMRQLKGLPRSSKAEVLQEATTWVALLVSELAHHADVIVPFAEEIHALTPCGLGH
jgi:hypothetical protein